MKIKICGLNNAANINELRMLDIDIMGFIFYDKSPRYFYNGDAKQLKDINKTKAGVFVNADYDKIMKEVGKHELNIVQLHSNETPELCLKLKSNGLRVIKAIQIDNKEDFNTIPYYEGTIDYFLFDKKTEQYGGSGKRYNWNILNDYELNIPFFLSGGISLEHTEEIMSLNNILLYALDINSRFEMSAGIKDTKKIEEFIKIIKG
ncbi:MAG: hypothetical protein A2X12_09370 [Bacteroidetes bacterium GWE2_29_8]|nr:MAG: hypothetical protein A2X12_09370 [Bacteroidetes bacterium GWE2_29_8]OFY17979.1 MAG: hypothetical protein A2X02_04905 [Bacteroidetes bacterium GWF2_29_10]